MEASFSLEALGSADSEVTSLMGGGWGGGGVNGDQTAAGDQGSDNMMWESLLVKLMVHGG